MGGMGSGRKAGYSGRKTTVEEVLHIDAIRWQREGILAAGSQNSGRWIWFKARQPGKEHSSIKYEARIAEDGSGEIRLCYKVGGAQEALDYRVRLQTTRPHLGGLRWWFTCPLVKGGRPCGRRVARLYIRGRYFGCRRCHDLVYTSSPEAHQDERRARGRARWEAALGLVDIQTASAKEVLALLRYRPKGRFERR